MITETNIEHTELPWRLIDHGINKAEYGHGIVHSFGGSHRFVKIENVGILETVDMDIPKLEANARLIIKAVNCHKELVAALKQVARDCKAGSLDHSIYTIEQIEAALSKV